MTYSLRLCRRRSRLGRDDLPDKVLNGLLALLHARDQLSASIREGCTPCGAAVEESLNEPWCAHCLDYTTHDAGEVGCVTEGNDATLVRLGRVRVEEDVLEQMRQRVVNLFDG